MSLLGRIFDTPEAINKTIETVASGLDKLVYTKEEQADAAAAMRVKEMEQIGAARGMVVEWMKATSGQNLARRWLTVVVTSVWLSLYVGAAMFATVSVFMSIGPANRALAASGIMAGYANELANIVMVIILFYFAAPHMGQAIDILLQRIGMSGSAHRPRTPPQG